MRLSFTRKGVGEWFSAVAAVATLVIMVVYIVYTSGLSTLNPTVVICMVLTVLFNIAYFMAEVEMPVDVLGILEIAAVIMTAYSLVTFLRASINNLADLLNGIQIFSGATGSVPAIFSILITLLVIGIVEIVACFLGKGRRGERINLADSKVPGKDDCGCADNR